MVAALLDLEPGPGVAGGLVDFPGLEGRHGGEISHPEPRPGLSHVQRPLAEIAFLPLPWREGAGGRGRIFTPTPTLPHQGGGRIGLTEEMPWILTQQVAQVPFFLVAENGLHPRQGRHFRRGSLSIAAGDPDGRVRVLPGQAADSLAGLLVGPGGDGTGVHDHQVRVGPRGRGAPPQTRKLPGHAGRVTLVHLAAESDNMEKTVLGFRVPVFCGHFQGLPLKESKSSILAKIWEKAM